MSNTFPRSMYEQMAQVPIQYEELWGMNLRKRVPLLIMGEPRMVRGFVEVDLGMRWFRNGTHYHVIYDRDHELNGRYDRLLIIEGPGEPHRRILDLAYHLAWMGRLEFLAPDDIRILQLIQMAAFGSGYVHFDLASAPQ